MHPPRRPSYKRRPQAASAPKNPPPKSPTSPFGCVAAPGGDVSGGDRSLLSPSYSPVTSTRYSRAQPKVVTLKDKVHGRRETAFYKRGKIPETPGNFWRRSPPPQPPLSLFKKRLATPTRPRPPFVACPIIHLALAVRVRLTGQRGPVFRECRRVRVRVAESESEHSFPNCIADYGRANLCF